MVYTRILGGTGFWNETAMYRLAKAPCINLIHQLVMYWLMPFRLKNKPSPKNQLFRQKSNPARLKTGLNT